MFFSFNTHFFKYSTYSTKHYRVFEWGDSSNHYSTYSSLNPNYLHIHSPTDTVQSLKRSQDTELTLSLYLSCQSLIVFLQFQFKFNAPPPTRFRVYNGCQWDEMLAVSVRSCFVHSFWSTVIILPSKRGLLEAVFQQVHRGRFNRALPQSNSISVFTPVQLKAVVCIYFV